MTAYLSLLGKINLDINHVVTMVAEYIFLLDTTNL